MPIYDCRLIIFRINDPDAQQRPLVSIYQYLSYHLHYNCVVYRSLTSAHMLNQSRRDSAFESSNTCFSFHSSARRGPRPGRAVGRRERRRRSHLAPRGREITPRPSRSTQSPASRVSRSRRAVGCRFFVRDNTLPLYRVSRGVSRLSN